MPDPLEAHAQLEVEGRVEWARCTADKEVDLVVEATLDIDGVSVHGVTPFDWPSLERQMQALVDARKDPIMMGTTGFNDNVWPMRLWGTDS